MSKNLDPNIQPEKQTIKSLKGNEISQVKPRIGHGRAGMRRKKPYINQPIAQSAEHSNKIPEVPKIEKRVTNLPSFATPVQSIGNSSTKVINRRTMQKISKDISVYLDPTYRPPPKPMKIPMSESPENIDISPELNTKFEENSPFEEGVISEKYQRPDKSFS